MSRGTGFAAFAAVLALFADSVFARSLASYESDLTSAGAQFDEHCASYYEDGPPGDVPRAGISRLLVDRLGRSIDEIERELGEQLRFLSDPEAHINRSLLGNLVPLRERFIHERDELDAMRMRGADFAQVEVQRRRVQESRSRWEGAHSRARDPVAFHRYKDEQVTRSQRRVGDLRRIHERYSALYSKAWTCNNRAREAQVYADDTLNPPVQEPPPAVADCINGWGNACSAAGGGSNGGGGATSAR